MRKVHEKLDQDVVDALIKLKQSGDSYSDIIRWLILIAPKKEIDRRSKNGR